MKAPLPEVAPDAPQKRGFAKAPPLALTVICALNTLIWLLLFALPFFQPSTLGFSRFWEFNIQGVVAALFLGLIYWVWRGNPWARGLWVLGMVLRFLSSFYPEPLEEQRSHIERTLLDFGYALGLLLAIWIVASSVKMRFARHERVE